MAGKLFVTREDGSDQYGTGQFVAPNLILTAAHVVFSNEDGNRRFYGNPRFYRGYCDGDGELFEIVEICLWKHYVRQDTGFVHTYDYAYCRTSTELDEAYTPLSVRDFSDGGQPSLPLVGDEVEAIGYPGDISGGQRMQKVTGTIGSTVPDHPSAGIMMMKNNPLGPGCSGGAWMSGNLIVSVNSYGPDNREYGPQLQLKSHNLRTDMEGGW